MFIGLVTAQAHDMEAMKYYNLGLVSTLTSKKIKYFTEALKLNPALVEVYEKRGLLYYFQEKYDEVIQDFQKYIELSPAKADDYRMLGLGFLKSHIYNRAIDNFTHAIKLQPGSADAYADRAEAYRLIGRYNDAIRDSTKAIEIGADPGTLAEAYKTRAKSYLAIGRDTEAFADNYKVTSLDPKYLAIWGKSQPINTIGAMGLFILNAIVFLFLFELRPHLLRIDKFQKIYMLSSKFFSPRATDTVPIEKLNLLIAEVEKILFELQGSQKIIFGYLGHYKKAVELLGNFKESHEAFSNYVDSESYSKIRYLLNNCEQKIEDPPKLLSIPNHFKINDTSINCLNAIPKLHTASLKVYMFGKFRVFQGEQEILDKRWKSKKALMIFKYLLYHRPKGYLKKDVLMELLWPEEDPAKTAKRFHVALASMRKTLEPEIIRGTPSAYILRSGDGYCIDIGDEGYVDIDNFKKELKLAKKAKDSEKSIEHLLKAEAIYGGDFLEEDLYVLWCDEERERYKEEYLQLLEEIIKYYHVKKDYEKCIYYANKYLKTDKYAENIYQLLMIYYSRIGNNAMVNKIFNKSKDNILKGLDCPVSKETEKLYHELTS